MYSTRPPSLNNVNSNKNNRLSELLDAIKQQVDAVSQEAVHYKLQRDELEHKCKNKSRMSLFFSSISTNE